MSAHTSNSKSELFAGGGEVGALMRSLDWSQTAFGPADAWSPALQMMVRLLLANRFQLILWWGPEFHQLYNDAYRPVLGAKHPQALGQPGRECWPEIWHIIGPLVERPFHGGEATWMEDILLEINRFGFTEETHFTIAYSLVPDDTVPSGIGGVLGTVHEITGKVIGERRTVLLRDLSARAAEAKTVEEACALAAATIAQHPEDVPFALLYVLDEDRQHARLAGAAGVRMGEAASPLVLELDDTPFHPQPWPLAKAMWDKDLQLVEDLSTKLGRDHVPPGPWSDPPHSAVVMPIPSHVTHQLAGLLVLGVSPRLQFDDHYRGFCDLVTSQIATAIANARAYEEERKRTKALAEIDRAKTVFFSNVSHEFRTPLTLMLGPLEEMLALGNGALKEKREELTLVHRNGLRLLKLVNTLLDFSRIEAGRVQASYKPTDLAVFTADLASSFRSAIEKAGLRLVVDCPPLPHLVYVDRDMWEKIVFNLLSNAFKFTFVGEIRVALHPSLNGAAAKLSVCDTGTGIPPAELPRLFERFHRIEGARGRTHEGTGIGLALVQELVRLHGGQIEVQSRTDAGSTFTVRLPFGASHLPRERIEAASTLVSTATRTETYVEEALRWLPEEETRGQESGNESQGSELNELLPSSRPLFTDPCSLSRILLVDDNIDMRNYVQRLLSPHYQVTAVANGQEALACAFEHPPDLVLSDVMMPQLDGVGLLKALRHAPSTSTIPVILLTARAGEEARIEGLEAGADDYIVKPFSARELLARVNARLEIARIRAQAEAVLRDSELRYRLTALATNDVLWDWDLVTDEARWTNALQSLFGYTEDDIGPDATWWYEHIHAEDRERSISGLHALISSGQQFWSAEYRFRRRDGSYAYIFDRGYIVHDKQGKPVRMVGAMIDLSTRKQAEDERERLVVELQRINTELQQFSYIVSHDLNEPLRTMHSYVQLLAQRLEGQLEGEAKEDMAFIVDAAQRMQQMLADLLAYTHAGHAPQFQTVDYEVVLADVLNALQAQIEARDAVIMHEPLPAVHGDATRLGQVFQNLIGNALKFCTEQPRIHISTRQEDHHWRFAVRDNGIGIAPIHAKRLFQVFQRLHTRRECPGTGIGLAICKKIVEQHGGQIWVESRPTEGATFYFTISKQIGS